MRVLLALVVIGGLFAAAMLVPVGGETAWHAANRQGLPARAAKALLHATARGATWIAAKIGDEPKTAPTRAPRHRAARAAAPPPPAAAASRRERILPAPPKEHLAGEDRAALDQLLTSQAAR